MYSTTIKNNPDFSKKKICNVSILQLMWQKSILPGEKYMTNYVQIGSKGSIKCSFLKF